MIQSNQKTSLLVASQLPEFIREDPSYANFVAFVQAYYEWLEQEGNVTDVSKNLLTYKDIDETTTQFLDFFTNDFLPFFPADILTDKTKVIKIAKELYQTKGTPASYKFLFRILYNTDVDFFFTEDAVLKASSGTWYVAQSLNLASNNPNFLNIANLRIFGETTKSIATIETSTFDGTKTEVFISNIERLFQSGEFVRVVDSNNQDVYFLNGQQVPVGTPGAETLSAKVIGQISQVKVDPNNRGLAYQPGDPVVFYGGLNSNTGHGATATVATTTSGSIQRVTVLTGGYGYTAYPNTVISFNDLNAGAAAPIAVVGSLNPAGVANVSLIPTDVIALKRFEYIGNVYHNGLPYSVGANTKDPRNESGGAFSTNWTQSQYNFANNLTANANTSLANAFTFTGFSTYPIGSILVQNAGGGITQPPTVVATSEFAVEDSLVSNLTNLGILAPIQIVNGGLGYQVNDTIVFSGGTGYGAHANVTQVASNGMITAINYVYSTYEQTPHRYPLGGMGYRVNGLPSVTVHSANTQASNASIYVPGVLGSGATFSPVYNRVGSISTFNITDPGTDYISTPNISLKVQDICVSNVSITNLPTKGDIVYQGVSLNNSSYIATVDSITQLVSFANTAQSLYNIRLYNYNNVPNYNLPLVVEYAGPITNPGYHPTGAVLRLNNSYASLNVNSKYDSSGVITYGDGTARGNTSFLNGLAISQGQYLDSSGQLSSYDVLQSPKYNNYTYEITLEKEIAAYRKTLLDLLHPSGMQVIGRFAMKGQANINFTESGYLDQGHTLGYYTGDPGSYASMTSDYVNQSNNIIQFGSLVGANLQQIILPNDSITLTLTNGFQVRSEVISINDGQANTVVLKDNVWLTYANVAYVTANAGSNVINISSLTGSYDIVNNENYSNTAAPILDIVYPGDHVLVANNSELLVIGVNASANTITVGSNLTSAANSLMTVRRTVLTTNVRIDGPVGTQFFPELTDQFGNRIVTQNNDIILLG